MNLKLPSNLVFIMKMKKNLIIILIIYFICLPCQSKSKNKCPQNSEPAKCMPKCLKTCTKLDANCGKNCRRSGCVCKDSFVLNEKKKCIPIKDCPQTTTTILTTTMGTTITTTNKVIDPKKCPSNETFFTHKPTCTRKCPGLPKDLCTSELLPAGCACSLPYVTNATGNCILKKDCPMRSYPTTLPTTPNPCVFPWRLVQCRSYCTETCDYALQSDCLIFCLPRGCSCIPPFVLNRNGECIRKEQCPKTRISIPRGRSMGGSINKCPENMSLVSGKDSCERKCNQTVDYSKCMKISYNQACECRYPYALNSEGECIREEDCPK